MSGTYGTPTDPVPFLIAAYGLALVGIVGYWIYLYRSRKSLLKKLVALEETAKHE